MGGAGGACVVPWSHGARECKAKRAGWQRDHYNAVALGVVSSR